MLNKVPEFFQKSVERFVLPAFVSFARQVNVVSIPCDHRPASNIKM